MPPLVVIIGETASGKSTLALELAEKFNGEIICADSWTVYKGFNVGTAKPSPEDQARIRHHLLDVADPEEGFSAVMFQRLAKAAISDVHSRGKLAFLVGGTGLYIDSVVFDYGFLPPSSPELREKLNGMSLDQIVEKAIEQGLDTTNIDLRNKRRVIRLIENDGIRPTKKDTRDNTLILGLSVPRDELEGRIEKRIDGMIDSGLEHEVHDLAEKYNWQAEPMKGIGYREWQAYFLHEQTGAETRARIVKATLDLAKRQRTWFKRNSLIHWLLTEDKIMEADELVTTFLNTNF